MTENTIRHTVRKILAEKSKPVPAGATRRPGRGGYKKTITATGALAKENPRELMNRLKITAVRDKEEIKRLNSLFKQAVSGVPAMQAVYSEPSARKDKKTGYEGIRIPVRIIPARDARKYLEHTLVGAQNSRTAIFDSEIQVEILGDDILMYFSPKPYSWGRAPKKKKTPPKPATPTPASETPPETMP